MNKIKNILKVALLIPVLLWSTSCDESNFLQETPKDFYSVDNSYVTPENFDRSLNDLYSRIREMHYGGFQERYYVHFLGTDIAQNARMNASWLGDYNSWMDPTNSVIAFTWREWYKVISNANTIISRVEESELNENQRSLVAAEAKLFRAYAYRYLVYLYGGVPLIVEEINSPKTDFTRATREEVLNQIVSDARDAADTLPAITDVQDGKLSNLVAQHLLAETYISLGQYDDAITAASVVIDDPNTELMTERFGTRADEQIGDVYWDLFRRGNQNRSEGNMEGLWVIQMGLDIPGAHLSSTTGNNNGLNRAAAPATWSLTDPDGNPGTLGARSDLNIGGRGVSNMMNTDFFLNDLWESDWDNDIRNASHNIIRDVVYDNPESAWYDSSAVEYPGPTWLGQQWRWYPWPSKITTPGNHPEGQYSNIELQLLKNDANSTYRDMYFLRLAETYLLRAEAYLKDGQPGEAALDINEVRERSNATSIDASDVTLDYILDERARELIYEEHRRITLHRTGKFVERTRKYNDLSGDQIQDYHELWPIPFSEREANKDAELKQNPGYN